MVSCAVYGCTNQSPKTKGSGIRYYRFPRSNYFKKKWLVFFNGQDQINVEEARVCSNHFREDAYFTPLGQPVSSIPLVGRQLKDDAVPTENPPMKWEPEDIPLVEERMNGPEEPERREDEDLPSQSPKRLKSYDSPPRNSQEDNPTHETHYILTLPRQMCRPPRRRRPCLGTSTHRILRQEQASRPCNSPDVTTPSLEIPSDVTTPSLEIPSDVTTPDQTPNNIELVFGCSETELQNISATQAPDLDLLTHLQLRPIKSSSSDPPAPGLTTNAEPDNAEPNIGRCSPSPSGNTTGQPVRAKQRNFKQDNGLYKSSPSDATTRHTLKTKQMTLKQDNGLYKSSPLDTTTRGRTVKPKQKNFKPCIGPPNISSLDCITPALAMKATAAKAKKDARLKGQLRRDHASAKLKFTIERLKAQNASLKYERDSLLLAREAWRKERKELSKKASCNKTAIVFVSDINAISNMPN